MFDRTAVMTGQKSKCVSLSDQPSHFSPGGSRKQVSALGVMVELAFYPAVALIYFFGVMSASKEERVELDDRASVNVFCLFVLAQPLCLVLGGYTGMAAYLLTALVSYNFLPWKPAKEKAKAKGKESKKKKE